MRLIPTLIPTLPTLIVLGIFIFPKHGFTFDLDKEWRFSPGDNPEWAKPNFADQDWDIIEVDKPWERSGYENYDGFGWYRLRTVLSKKSLNSPYLEFYQKLRLHLGPIADADITYFNGVQIARTGSLPMDNKQFANVSRLYDVPEELVEWGSQNVIAVRVYNGQGKGGFYKKAQTIAPLTWVDLTSVSLGVGRGDGIYPADRPITVDALLENKTFEELEGTIHWQISTDAWHDRKRETLINHISKIKISAGKSSLLAWNYQPPQPGFYHVSCSFKRNGQEEVIIDSGIRGYGPESIIRKPDSPDDLDQFWNQAKSELLSVDPRYKIDKLPEWDTKLTDCYLVEMRSVGQVRIRGWFEIPKGKGPYPVVLRVPGYTQTMMPVQSISDMAVFSLNIRGHGNSTDDEPAYNWWGPGDYVLRGIHTPQKYFYRAAILDCVRALDFLTSSTKVDPKRIAITGGSQGGLLSFATAALDKRIFLCAPDIPFVMDSMRSFEITNWPGSIIRQWVERSPENNTWQKARNTMKYVDPKNLAKLIECPVFMGVCLQDQAAPPFCAFAAFNQCNGVKEYRIYPNDGHATPPEHISAKLSWIRAGFGIE